MFLDWLFPKRCLGCGQWGSYFCSVCLEEIKPLSRQICPVCQKPAISGKTHARCQTKYSLDGLTNIFPYQGAIKEAMIKLKYKFVTDLAEELVSLVTLAVKLPKFLKKAILVPVPLHPRRKRWRGFNQAELLGKMLAEKFGWQVETNLLLRHKYTQPQIKLKSRERRKNIKGAFGVHKNSQFVTHNSQFVIFDDVWTTGSTMRECGSSLKRAGVEKVWGLSLAR